MSVPKPSSRVLDTIDRGLPNQHSERKINDGDALPPGSIPTLFSQGMHLLNSKGPSSQDLQLGEQWAVTAQPGLTP